MISKKFLFTSDLLGHIKVWSLRGNKLIKDFGKAHNDQIRSIICTNDEKYLISSDISGVIKLWSISTNFKLIKTTVNVHTGSIFSMTVTKNSEYLYTSSLNGEIKQFGIDQRDGKIQLVQNFGKFHEGEISVILATNQNLLLTSDTKSNVKMWWIDSITSSTTFDKNIQVLEKVGCMAVTYSGKHLFCGTYEGSIIKYDLEDSDF